MSHDSPIHVLAAVRFSTLVRYRDHLARDPQIKLTLVTSESETRETLADPQQRTDVVVLDQALCDVFSLIRELRQTYPRLLIVLVDEEADFSIPGQADEVSVSPFEDNDLLKRIKRLTEERRLETLRADTLPPVRQFAKSLRRTVPGQSKQSTAVEAIKELGYDYVVFYSLTPTTPPEMTLNAQVGPRAVTAIAPQKQDGEKSLVGWVYQNGQSRIVGPDDEPNHPFIKQGRFGTGVCVPVGTSLRFGVILACREQPNAITQQNVLMLELVCAQLASALVKQAKS
ncbi:MAG: GAF domain-containing protein [Chloroflexi bacterium]|nr:GAF domain-containing protein [Chloroflexota bacterium]